MPHSGRMLQVVYLQTLKVIIWKDTGCPVRFRRDDKTTQMVKYYTIVKFITFFPSHLVKCILLSCLTEKF